MRVLLIKTSSMGDIIHTFPALTDALQTLKEIQFDWVVEEAFVELPKLHPAVKEVIPVALRRFRKKAFHRSVWQEWGNFYRQLRKSHYDLVLDAQGLIKSAALSYLARGVRAGLDFNSARENFAALAYQKTYRINFYQHAIIRMRTLFSMSLNYPLPNTQANVGLHLPKNETKNSFPYVVFLHGTTWQTKEWPEAYWIELAKLSNHAGFKVKMSGGRRSELERAYRMAAFADIDVLPTLGILDMAYLLINASAVISVDTGFGHLAAALDVPIVSLYGATDPAYTGAIGPHSRHLVSDFPCAPCLKQTCTFKRTYLTKPACYTLLPPMRVWIAVKQLMNEKEW